MPPDPATLGPEDAASWTVELWRAGEDCRAKVRGIAAWAAALPGEVGR